MSLEHMIRDAGPNNGHQVNSTRTELGSSRMNGQGNRHPVHCADDQPPHGIDTSHRPFGMVLLAGVLTPSPLRQQLDIPALSLPLASNLTLLDLWLEVAERARECQWLKIVVNLDSDKHLIEGSLDRSHHVAMARRASVIMDPMPWRGPAGLLRDLVHDSNLGTEFLVLGAEAACLPPPSLESLIAAMSSNVGGAVACTSTSEPAGVYGFRAGILSSISPRGFHDIKEQLLPSLFSRGIPVVPVTVVDQTVALRSPMAYLGAVATTLSAGLGAVARSPLARVSESAQVTTDCLIHDDSVIEDGAIVHRSVILPGARIGGGAVVSNSIIGEQVQIERCRVVKEAVMTHSASLQSDLARARRSNRALPLKSGSSEKVFERSST